jgi:hypothetical protein
MRVKIACGPLGLGGSNPSPGARSCEDPFAGKPQKQSDRMNRHTATLLPYTLKDLARLAAKHNFCILATQGVRSPHVAGVGYFARGLDLYIPTSANTVKARMSMGRWSCVVSFVAFSGEQTRRLGERAFGYMSDQENVLKPSWSECRLRQYSVTRRRPCSTSTCLRT